MIIVDKTRKLWLFKHTRIHLDMVKGLGNFLELETICKGISYQDAIIESRAMVKILQLKSYQKIKESYSDLKPK